MSHPKKRAGHVSPYSLAPLVAMIGINFYCVNSKVFRIMNDDTKLANASKPQTDSDEVQDEFERLLKSFIEGDSDERPADGDDNYGEDDTEEQTDTENTPEEETDDRFLRKRRRKKVRNGGM